MFARVNVTKFVVGTVNQNVVQRFLEKYPRHLRKHILRSCTIGTKSDELYSNDDTDSDSTNRNHYLSDDNSRHRHGYSDRHRYSDRPRFSDKHGYSDRHRFSDRNRFSDRHSFSERYSFSDRYEPDRRNRYSDREYGSRSNFDFNIQRKEKPEYKEFQKNFYVEQESVKNRPTEEVQEFLKEHQIVYKGNNILNPVSHFEEAGFPDNIKRRLANEGFEEPTPIQRITWPHALSGRDVVGIAQTGSGKTLGFMLPAFVHIQHQEPLRPGDGPICLVLAPTRELSQQIRNVAVHFGSACRIKSCIVHGGANRYPQIENLRRGAHVCIATPGRMLDYLSSGETDLNRCTYLVVDEADKMLDMGFEPQIRNIIDQIRPDRQTLMWSATWPEEVRGLARDYLTDFVQMNVGSTKLTANPNIKQKIIVCDEFDKMKEFNNVIRDLIDSNEKVLIFTRTKSSADNLSWKCESKGIRSVSIHGDKSQLKRDRALHDFRTGRINVMFATDVASRGLDVSDITYVINYDFPDTVEGYIHRIGRTGRAGNKGTAVSFITTDHASLARDLVSVMKESNQEVNEDLLDLCNMSFRKSKRNPVVRSNRMDNFTDRYRRFSNRHSDHRNRRYTQINEDY